MNIILDDKEVTTIIERLAIDIFQHMPDMKNLAIIGIQSRGDKIAERLIKLLEVKMSRRGDKNHTIPLGILNINFYRDDVFYTGRTVRAALDAIFEVGRPSRIAMLTLISRSGRELPVLPEFIGLDLNVGENEYVKVKLKEVEGEDLVCILSK